jgi:hypothetical protein
MRYSQGAYRRVVGLISLIVVIALGIAVLVFTSIRDHDFQMRRAALLSRPIPTPAWVQALGPVPGETVPIESAVYGVGIENRFWPGAGVICAQIDSVITNITSPDQLLSQVTIKLNEGSVQEAGAGRLRWGTQSVPGSILPSRAKQTSSLNVCWRMILDPGEYLVELQVTQGQEPPLVYSWAFRLTEK